MIRVMIVEDEPHAQRRLQRMIERLDDFFRIEATAMDGEEALDILKTTRCDVVFTDIRMPIMDGVELMQRVRRQYPEMMLVVLSGYSDFSYVSEAVRSQAVDYLLKPLTEEALSGLLAQLKERYLAREHEQIRRKLAERINKAAPPSGGENAPDERLGAFLLCAGALPICESPEMCPGAEFWSGGALREAAAETINELSTFNWEFMGNTPSERIVVLRADLGELPQIAALLHSAVLARSDMPVSCVCHREPISLVEIDRTLKALRKELEQRGRIGESLLLESPGGPWRPRGDEEALQEASNCLSRNDAAALARLFARFEQEKWSQGELYRLFSMAITQVCDRTPVAYARAQRLRAALADSISSALSMEELRSDLSSLSLSGEDVSTETASVAQRIEHYLRKNYAEHITNQTLGGVFGYVPSYVSMLFRREYGISPSEYLTDIRIEQAKRLLLENPNALIRDVALDVGFKSQHHFSRTFKNHEGLWPSDFVHERRPS